MRQIFEPGDGSFEIILDHAELLPPEWNILGVAVWRENPEDGDYRLIKDYCETLTGIQERI